MSCVYIELQCAFMRLYRSSEQEGVQAATTATADKTSLKNKQLRNGNYFAIIAFCSHSILLTNYAKTGQVGGVVEFKI